MIVGSTSPPQLLLLVSNWPKEQSVAPLLCSFFSFFSFQPTKGTIALHLLCSFFLFWFQNNQKMLSVTPLLCSFFFWYPTDWRSNQWHCSSAASFFFVFWWTRETIVSTSPLQLLSFLVSDQPNKLLLVVSLLYSFSGFWPTNGTIGNTSLLQLLSFSSLTDWRNN